MSRTVEFNSTEGVCLDLESVIFQDQVLEYNETFDLRIDSMEDAGVSVNESGFAVVTILNDDGKTGGLCCRLAGSVQLFTDFSPCRGRPQSCTTCEQYQ